MSPAFPMEGGCLCGAIRYRLEEDPVMVYACHCTDCQTETGASFTLNMVVRAQGLVTLQGEVELREVRTPEGRLKRAMLCPACRVPMWGVPSRFPDLRGLSPGTLDDTRWFSPAAHIWVRSKQPWIEIPAGVLCFEQEPGDEDTLEMVRAWKGRTR